jgi:hypothetical protein
MKITFKKYQWKQKSYVIKLDTLHNGKMYRLTFYKWELIIDSRKESANEFCESYEMKRQKKYCKEQCEYCSNITSEIKAINK